MHHFGSKDGLRQEVDQYVLDVFEAMLGELTGDGGAELLDPGAGASSLSEVFARHLPDDSPLPSYLQPSSCCRTRTPRSCCSGACTN